MFNTIRKIWNVLPSVENNWWYKKDADSGLLYHRFPFSWVMGPHSRKTKADRLSACVFCQQKISRSIATLEKRVINKNRNVPVLPTEHYFAKLMLSGFNKELSGSQSWDLILPWWVDWGNVYLLVTGVNQLGNPTELTPIHPSRVPEENVFRDESGKKIIRVFIDESPASSLQAKSLTVKDYIAGRGLNQIIHLKATPGDNIDYGLGTLERALYSTGLSAQLTELKTSFYQNRPHINQVISVDQSLTTEQYKRLYESFTSRQDPTKAYRPLILENGGKFLPPTVPPEQLMMLEMYEHTIEEIHRFYDVPIELGKFRDVKNDSPESIMAFFVSGTLLYHWEMLSSQLKSQILGPKDQGVLELSCNFESLLRGDLVSLASYLRQVWSMGGLTTDELRHRIGVLPIGGKAGDQRYVQAAFIPQEQVDLQTQIFKEQLEQSKATTESFKNPPDPEAPQDPNEKLDDSDRGVESLRIRQVQLDRISVNSHTREPLSTIPHTLLPEVHLHLPEPTHEISTNLVDAHGEPLKADS